MFRRRWLLLAAPLAAVVIATGVAVAAPTGTGYSTDAKLDKLHAERPTAASDRILERLTEPVLNVAAVDAHLKRVQLELLENLFDQIKIGNFIAAVQAEEAAQAEAAAAAEAARRSSVNGGRSSGGGGGGGDALACIRARESDTSGGYSAVSAGGTYRGAYQFLPGTWNSTAASSGRDDLVGVDPASAAPADQDAMASQLYSQAGSQPWGGTC